MMKMSANTTNLTCLLPSIRSFTLQVLIEYLISGPKSYRDVRETDVGWTLLEMLWSLSDLLFLLGVLISKMKHPFMRLINYLLTYYFIIKERAKQRYNRQRWKILPWKYLINCATNVNYENTVFSYNCLFTFNEKHTSIKGVIKANVCMDDCELLRRHFHQIFNPRWWSVMINGPGCGDGSHWSYSSSWCFFFFFSSLIFLPSLSFPPLWYFLPYPYP